MLRYLKRQTSRRRSSQEDSTEAAAAATADETDSTATTSSTAVKRHSLRSTTSFCDEIFMEQLTEAEEAAAVTMAMTEPCNADSISICCNNSGGGCGSGFFNMGADEDIFKYNSRLSMTLTAIVHEPNCLSYFLQYLEQRSALPLIKFFMDTEHFKKAALTQIERETQREFDQDVCKKEEAKQEEADNDDDEEQEEAQMVPELKTLCDLTMRRPLTDDEKSRIYAETNKQLKHNRLKTSTAATAISMSQLSLCSGLSDHAAAALSAASIRDAIAIYQKYLIGNARLFVALPIGILAHISLLLCGKSAASDGELEKPIPASCFDEAREYVLQQLERDHLPGFLQSSYYCKYCVELIEGAVAAQSQLNVYDVLYSELALFYFTEYLEQQHERECLEFWITAINFRKSFASSSANEEEARSDAMIIYEKYFSLQSECRLWMSDKLRSRVEQTICAPGQLAYAFDLALLVTAKYLEQKYFKDFLKSNIFDNYVNELKAKQGSQVAESGLHRLSLRRPGKLGAQQKQQRHRKALSMSDYTHISQHNTLLASADKTPVKQQPQAEDALPPSSQLLWQRSSSNGVLKFGRVNSLGRYERDFEAVDAVTLKSQPWSLSLTSSGSKIKNAMRKLVNLPEDNVQEEIAWQVAEMIVKDVTNVTLNGQLAGKPMK